jgi:hypothetical protein
VRCSEEQVRCENVFKAEDTNLLTQGTLYNLGQEKWAALCKHVQKIVEKYVTKEQCVDNIT